MTVNYHNNVKTRIDNSSWSFILVLLSAIEAIELLEISINKI